MTHYDMNNAHSDVWFIDSGYSNHMTSMKKLFRDLDETKKMKVKLGDNKEMQVEGKGTVAVKSSNGKVRLLYDVQYVPDLAYNLLSVGHLVASGCSVVFEKGICKILEKQSGKLIANVQMTKNKMFPLGVSSVVSMALAANVMEVSKLCHLRYGHLNINGLKLLSQKEMVYGLPKMESIDLCEGCTYGKQGRKSFPSQKAWKATRCLELIHADLCRSMNIESLGGNLYFFLLTDDYSRMSWVCFLENC